MQNNLSVAMNNASVTIDLSEEAYNKRRDDIIECIKRRPGYYFQIIYSPLDYMYGPIQYNINVINAAIEGFEQLKNVTPSDKVEERTRIEKSLISLNKAKATVIDMARKESDKIRRIERMQEDPDSYFELEPSARQDTDILDAAISGYSRIAQGPDAGFKSKKAKRQVKKLIKRKERIEEEKKAASADASK